MADAVARGSDKPVADSHTIPPLPKHQQDHTLHRRQVAPRAATDALDPSNLGPASPKAPPERPGEISPLSPSSDDSDDSGVSPDNRTQPISASQILQRSDVFHPPPGAMYDKNAFNLSSPRLMTENSDESAKTSSSDSQQYDGSYRSSTAQVFDISIQSTDTQPVSAPEGPARTTTSSPSLRNLVRAGAEPLSKASGIAGLFWARSQRLRRVLSSESKGYYEKVSGMWAGQRMHYDDGEGHRSMNDIRDPDDEAPFAKQVKRFRAHFALPDDEKLVATFHGYLNRLVPVFGKFYLGVNRLCFRSLLPGTRTKVRSYLTFLSHLVPTNTAR